MTCPPTKAIRNQPCDILPAPLNSQAKRVLCVGMCVMDFIHICEDYPEEDSDRRCLEGYYQRGGNASNNCTVLRTLGNDVEFLGMLSTSTAFSFLEEDCRQRQIRTTHCPTTSENPPFSSIILVPKKATRTIIHTNTGFPNLLFLHFRQICLTNYGWIHFEGRNPTETIQMIQYVREWNRDHPCEDNIQISVELEKVDREILPLAELADYVFLGKDLAKHLGWESSHTAIRGLRKTLKPLQIDNVLHKPVIICPWGSVGVAAMDSDDEEYYQHAFNVKNVIDSLGAGDTFTAAFIHATFTLAMDVNDALILANRCAAYKLKHRGYDAIVDFEQFE